MNLKLFFTGIFFWLGQLYFAQPVTINLSEDNIINRTEYNQILQSGVLYKGNGNWRSAGGEWYVMLKANQSTYSNGNFTLPTEIVNFRLNNINGVTPGTGQLKGIWPGYKNITTTFQSFFQPEKANSNAPKGAIMMNYQILSSSFPNYIFQSGSYIVSIDNNQAPNGTWWSSTNRYIDPSGWQMNISVPEFAKWFVTQNAFTYNYNSLSNFSSPQDLVFDLSNFQISHTTNAYLDAKAQGNISFIPHGGGIAADIPISNVEVFGTGLTTKTLSTSYQNINSSAYSVVAGNRNTIPIKIRINANAVKQQLYKAGTYTFTVDFKIRNNGGTVSDTQSVQFTITTQPLSTIAVQGTPDVNFTFATAADYQTGKSQNMANHLLVSNNKAFEIYVKSGTSNFTLNGTPTTLPSTIVQVENGTGQTGIITKTLTTTPQAILLGAAPSLNQNISLKYTIPAAQAASLLGQTTGATPYILNVIYSFTNQ